MSSTSEVKVLGPFKEFKDAKDEHKKNVSLFYRGFCAKYQISAPA